MERLKFSTIVRNSSVDKVISDDEEAVRLCNYTDVYYNDQITLDLDFKEGSATAGEIRRFQLKRGQVILTKDSESWEDIGIPALVTEDMPGVLCGYHLAALDPVEQDLAGGYLAWLCRSEPLNDQFKLGANGITRFGLGQYPLKNAFIALPPLETQGRIAKFLDEKTSRIDSLIEKKNALLDRLAEKRQALITHAVTKGLDPDVPMKPSGIAWLGNIPAHWHTQRIKHAVSHVVDCLHTTPIYDGEVTYPAIRTADVDRGRLLLDQARLVSTDVYLERIQRLKPVPGDVLYSREGERFGMAALVPKNIDLCLGQRMMMLRARNGVDSAYLMWALNSEAIIQQVMLYAGGSTSPHINIRDVINFDIPNPPPDEQHLIATQIVKTCNEIDYQTGVVFKSLSLLEEYRAALITAAVTGQLNLEAA